MKLLAVDIGNTHTVAGVVQKDGAVVSQWRIRTDSRETSDELGARMIALMQQAGMEPAAVNACIISSVVPPALNCWKGFVRHRMGCPLLCVNDHLTEIMDIRYSRPYEVGADRIVNAAAAWEKYRTDLVVVDFGTAITFDCVSQERSYLGGVIAPGPGLAASGLASGTSKLPLVELTAPKGDIIAQDTVSAIQAGLIYGFAALADGILERLANSFGKFPLCLATGGLAPVIIPHCRNISRLEPELTIEGLALIYSRYLS